MKHPSRLVVTGALLLALAAPAAAQELSQLAPADDYFGRFQLSVLGIANTIRDAAAELDAGADPAAVIEGPLDFANDAIADWAARYPRDPWIAKDLLALEHAYLKAPEAAGRELAAKTEAWLTKDYGATPYAALGRDALAPPRAATVAVIAPPKPRTLTAWERFAALRAGYPAR